jgi:hypothetical protein
MTTEIRKQIIGFDIGIRNFAYCIMEKSNDKVSIISLEKIDLECPKNDIQKIIDATLNLLDDIMYNKLNIAIPIVILIECQMTSIMKCIQTVINTYFKINSRNQSLDILTKYVSSKHKLNLIKNYENIYIRPDTIAKNQYKKNKIDSIHFAEWLIQNKYKDDINYNKLKSYKKKDDLADVFLMNIYYIESFL